MQSRQCWGLKKGGALKYLKAFPWGARKAQALQNVMLALDQVDSLLEYLSVSRWWVPDDLENLAKRMRPLVKQAKDPIKKGFNQGFDAMHEFIVDLIGEDGYRVVAAATTAAVSTNNKSKANAEKSNLIHNQKQTRKDGGKFSGAGASGSFEKSKTPKKTNTKQNAKSNKEQKATSVKNQKEKLSQSEQAKHNTVSDKNRQDVQKGTGTRTTATKYTIDKIGNFTNKLKGILGEHMADYHCQQIKGWGKETAKHDNPNAINSHKLNDGGQMVQLFELKSRGRGIDGVWKTNSGKPYAIIEAKFSENPIKSLGELLNDAKDKNGADMSSSTEDSTGTKQKNKKKKKNNQNKSNTPDIGGERSRQTNGKVMQMSHNWIQTRLRSTRLVLNDLFAKEDLLSDTNKVYKRLVLFFSVPQVASHLTALAQKASGEKVNHDIHIAHEVTFEWGDAAIAQEADRRGGLVEKNLNKSKRNKP